MATTGGARSNSPAAESENWLEGTPPVPISRFTGRRGSNPDAAVVRRPSLLRVSLGSPPELKARSLSTSSRGTGGPSSLTDSYPVSGSASPSGGPTTRQVPEVEPPPDWSELSDSLTPREVELVRRYLGCTRPGMAPRLRELLDRHIRPGRDPAEAHAAAVQELQELLFSEYPEEVEQDMAAHVTQLCNPFLSDIDSGSEPSPRRPRFNLLWIQALGDPKLAVDVAARWVFAGTRIAEQGDVRVREMCERVHAMTRALRLGRCRGPLAPSALDRLRDDDRDFYSSVNLMPLQRPWEEENKGAAKPREIVDKNSTGTTKVVRCALIYTECVGRVKMVDEEPRVTNPESLRVLPTALLPRLDAFLQLRGLPKLLHHHRDGSCYDAYVSPGTANTTVHTASTWQQTQNATVVIQRKCAAPFVSGARMEQDLRHMSDTLTKWVPLFRAYLEEYANLLGTLMMETPPHVSYAKVSEGVKQEFWPNQRVVPEVQQKVQQAIWGEQLDHVDFRMNFALLTTFLAHTAKLTAAMDELDLRWGEVVSGSDAVQEQEYRDLMREAGPLTNVVETLLTQVADLEFQKAKAEAALQECASLQVEKTELQGRIAVVNPPLSRIWSRQVLEEARTKIADVLHKNDILPHMKLNVDSKHRIEGWNKWLPAILASPDASRFLADEDLSRDAIELTATGDYDKMNNRTLHFQATRDAHQVSRPWIAEAIRCPELAFMRNELEAWFGYVYSRIGEDIDSSVSKFVPEFDPPIDHPNYFLAALHDRRFR